MSSETLLHKIAIGLIPGVGPVIAKRIIAYTGSIDGVFSESKNTLMKIPGIGPQLANSIVEADVLKRAEKEIGFVEKHNIKTYFYLDSDYPRRLQHCDDAPIMLYYKGNVDLNEAQMIGFVGTRNATSEGKENCNKLIEELSRRNEKTVIVSGLAFGIDITAHKAAIKHNLPTIAVLGNGLDKIYPSDHRPTAQEIVKNGAIITEYMSETKIDRNFFLQRNRIIAGLSDAVVVVESATQGGALVTAEYANNYNREVFAVPGRLSDKYSGGCNALIKKNKAALLQSVADIEYLLGWTTQKNTEKAQNQLFVVLNEEEQLIVDMLKENKELDIDSINFMLKGTIHKTSVTLLNLEFKNVVKCLPGKVYVLS